MISENQYDEYLDRLYPYDSDDPDDDQGITMASQVARAGTYILASYHDGGDTIWEGDCQPFADWLYQYVNGAKAVIDKMNENPDEDINKSINTIIENEKKKAEYEKKVFGVSEEKSEEENKPIEKKEENFAEEVAKQMAGK